MGGPRLLGNAGDADQHDEEWGARTSSQTESPFKNKVPYWAAFLRIQSIATNRWVDIHFQRVVLRTRLWVMFSSISPVHLIPCCLSQFCAYGSRNSKLSTSFRPLRSKARTRVTRTPNSRMILAPIQVRLREMR